MAPVQNVLTRERWGTFSVNDHKSEAAFVTEVLLYDRLIIPVPPTDNSQDEFWKRFDVDEQQRCLGILGVKTKINDGLALTVPWDSSKRQRFASRMSAAAALSTQKRSPEQTYYMDPFQMTRQLIKEEFSPALPPGVSKAWTVAAYSSTDAFHQETALADPNRGLRLTALVSHRFLTPTEKDPDHEILKKAVDLAATDDFRRKRREFYNWQESIIEQQISDQKAVDEMEMLLAQYNKAIEKAFQKVNQKWIFTLIPAAVALTRFVADPTSSMGLMLDGVNGLASVTRYFMLDQQPSIEAGHCDAAAMIYDAQDRLPLGDIAQNFR